MCLKQLHDKLLINYNQLLEKATVVIIASVMIVVQWKGSFEAIDWIRVVLIKTYHVEGLTGWLNHQGTLQQLDNLVNLMIFV